MDRLIRSWVGVAGRRPTVTAGAAVPDPAGRLRAEATAAFAQLEARITRLQPTGLGERSSFQASVEFHALCEGLAAVEMRGQLPPGREEQTWRNALSALLTGFGRTGEDATGEFRGVE